MYESPIEVMFRDIENRIREQEENAITAEVSRQMCVNVDKDELKRALPMTEISTIEDTRTQRGHTRDR